MYNVLDPTVEVQSSPHSKVACAAKVSGRDLDPNVQNKMGGMLSRSASRGGAVTSTSELAAVARQAVRKQGALICVKDKGPSLSRARYLMAIITSSTGLCSTSLPPHRIGAWCAAGWPKGGSHGGNPKGWRPGRSAWQTHSSEEYQHIPGQSYALAFPLERASYAVF